MARPTNNDSSEVLRDNGRTSNIRQRWRDIALYTIVSALIAELLAGLVVSSVNKVFSALGFRSTLPPLLLALALFIVPLLRHAWGRWRAFMGWNHFWQYPPIALAGILGTLLVVLTSHLASEVAPVFGESVSLPLSVGVDWKPVATALLLLLGVYFVVPTMMFFRPRRKLAAALSAQDASIGISPIVEDFPQLQAWISSDEYVGDPTRALFDHPRIARRIALRLLANQRCEVTTAIIGSIGSGKSSIIGLVEKYLRDNAKWAPLTFVKISLWGYDTPEAVTKAIL